MPKKDFQTSAQRKNSAHTAARQKRKKQNRKDGPKKALAAAVAASEARFDALPKSPHYRAAEDRW